MDRVVERAKARIPEALSFRITAADGTFTHGSDLDRNGAPVNFGDRDYFIAARDHPDGGLIVSPLLLGRLGKQWGVILARRINGPDGRFGGTAYALLPVTHLSKLFSALNLRAEDAVSIRGPDLSVIARFPANVDGAGVIGNKAISAD